MTVVAGHPVYADSEEISGRRCNTDMHGDGGGYLHQCEHPAAVVPQDTDGDTNLKVLCDLVSGSISEDSDFFDQLHKVQIDSIMDLVGREGGTIGVEVAERILTAVTAQFAQSTENKK